MNKQKINKNFDFLSMADLSRIANNEGEDIAIRRSALAKLDSRETRYCKTIERQPIRNYAPGL